MTDPFETLLDERYANRREPTVPGVLTAKVTGRMEDGTFELQYLSMGDNTPSAPARVMAPTAGAQRGSWTMPEIGDEVVVAFDAGDTNNPIILGAVWNDESPPPDQAEPSEDNHIRTFVSRAGHEITFDDRPAGGKVKIRTERGHEVLLDDTPPGKITISSATGNVIELDDATQTLTLRSRLAIALESTAITFGSGGVVLGPLSPSSPLSATPTPTIIESPLSIKLKSPLISLEATTIELKTTGSAATSMVTIDGKPFGTHTHGIPPGPITPPVTP